MSSLLQSTNNTRVLPTGTNQYFRSDFPDNLTDEEIQWLLDNNILTIIDLRSDEEILKKPCCLKETPLYNFLQKNNAQGTFRSIISLPTNPYERE